VEEHAYDQWDYLPSGMLVMRRPWAFALPVFDTGGEFMPGRQNNPGASERRPHSSLENWAKPNSPPASVFDVVRKPGRVDGIVLEREAIVHLL